jgi:hypothetical protein
LQGADPRRCVQQPPERRALPVDGAEGAVVLQRAVDLHEQAVRTVGLVMVALDLEVGKQLSRGLLGGISGHEQHLTDVVERADLLCHLSAGGLAQVVVEQDEMGVPRRNSGEGCASGRSALHVVTVQTEQGDRALLQRIVVIDDDRSTRSSRPRSSSSRRCSAEATGSSRP